jgi:hypothetical protein
MKGADAVRDQITLLLASEMPRKIPMLREAWDVDAARLPDVGRFHSGDLPDDALTSTKAGAPDSWVVVINPRLLRSVRTGDFNELGAPEYRSRYSCRVFIWAKGADSDDAIAARDKLAACARLCLFEYPTLTNEGGDTGFLIYEGTYTEDFGVPVRAAGSRCWAAAILSVDADVEEFVDDGSTVGALGSAEQIAATTTAVGPNQPLGE